ncbi:cyclase family protein [Chloroflexota bacterium]
MSYKIYDLSELFGDGTLMWPRLVGPISVPKRAFAGVTEMSHPGYPLHLATPLPSWPQIQKGAYEGHYHAATHIDAPIHVIDYGPDLDKIPLENCYGTGVVIDFRNKKKWDKITAEDFEKATPKIEPGDFVVCNTGWHKYWGQKEYVYFHHYPGLVPSGAEWLINKKVKAIAGTWATSDHSLAYAPLQRNLPHLYNEYKQEIGKDPGQEFPDYEPCLKMLIKKEIVCIQSAGGDIDKVTGKRCTLAAFPFRMDDADAGMVRLVAIVAE